MILLDFECPTHGAFEDLGNYSDAAGICCKVPGCCLIARRLISAPKVRVQYGAVYTGKSDERPPGMLDTRPLADGMPPHVWRAKNQAKIYGERRDKIRKEIL